MKTLSSLKNPENYRPGLWDLRRDKKAALHWKSVFAKNTDFICSMMKKNGKETHARDFKSQMAGIIKGIDNCAYETVHEITILRQDALEGSGVCDPFHKIKTLESESALSWLRANNWSHDIEKGRAFFSFAVRCLLDGNRFDLGSAETIALWERGELKFTLSEDRKDLENLYEAVLHVGDKSCVLLADNAGYDFTAGVILLSKALAREGFSVTVGANSKPALNDVIYEECLEISSKVSFFDDEWSEFTSSGKINFIPTGCRTPGIDLRNISEELDLAVSGAGIVIFTGQGRAVETTLNATLSCPVLRIAKIKDPMVAGLMGVDIFGDFIIVQKT
ncbi:DUF89 family protein [candidate division WOR-3 bacterium]|nr:DUF89 family protein [candidate division WOR-3 bacterium]